MGDKVKHYPFYIGGVEQVFPNVNAGTPKYAAAVVVGNIAFLSGMTAQDTETGACLTATVEEQVFVCLDKTRAVLEDIGSSMENIVKTLILLKDVKDYQLMRAAEPKYYQKHAPRLVRQPPASTFIMPASLARPEFLVEFDVTAVVERDD
jgi:2-iminobutanoate/2-iminopropanoate deaminase